MVKQMVLAVVLVLSAGSAWAQEVVTGELMTRIGMQFRDPQTWTSPEITIDRIPSRLLLERVRVVVDIPTADAGSPATVLQLALENYVPAGTPGTTPGWKFVTGGTWTGGDHLNPDTGLQEPPQIPFHPSSLHPAATKIRFVISWTERRRIGLRIETYIDE